MSDLYARFMQSVDRLSLQNWLLVFAVVVVIGVICMRGYGSRTNY